MPALVGFRTRQQGQVGHEALLAQAKMRADSQGFAAPGRPVAHRPRGPEEHEALSPIPSSRAAVSVRESWDGQAQSSLPSIHASSEPSIARSYASKDEGGNPLSPASKRILRKMKNGKSTRNGGEKQVRSFARHKEDNDSDFSEDDRDGPQSAASSPKRSSATNRPCGPRMRPPKPPKKEAWHGPWLALPKLCQVNLRRKQCEREVVGGPEERIVKERLRFMNMERGMEWSVLAAAAEKADAHAKLVGKLPPIFGILQ